MKSFKVVFDLSVKSETFFFFLKKKVEKGITGLNIISINLLYLPQMVFDISCHCLINMEGLLTVLTERNYFLIGDIKARRK